MDISALEQTLDYTFRDKALLKEALTHRSYLNENPGWNIPHNERLEFLGDAVLELAVTEELFHRYPDQPEGQLTALRAALVNYQAMARVANTVGLDQQVFLSRGEAKEGGKAREVILANAAEALLGALYLDGGFPVAKKWVNGVVLTRLEEVIREGLYRDAKSTLQEQAQAQAKITPTYRVLSEQGPEHEKVFRVGAYLGDTFLAEGLGPSKQEAEQEAAKNALRRLDEKEITL